MCYVYIYNARGQEPGNDASLKLCMTLCLYISSALEDSKLSKLLWMPRAFGQCLKSQSTSYADSDVMFSTITEKELDFALYGSVWVSLQWLLKKCVVLQIQFDYTWHDDEYVKCVIYAHVN